MSHAYIIEFDEIAAGIIAPDGQGFRFHHADRSFTALEGRRFSSYQQAERAARALLARLHAVKNKNVDSTDRRRGAASAF